MFYIYYRLNNLVDGFVRAEGKLYNMGTVVLDDTGLKEKPESKTNAQKEQERKEEQVVGVFSTLGF